MREFDGEATNRPLNFKAGENTARPMRSAIVFGARIAAGERNALTFEQEAATQPKQQHLAFISFSLSNFT